MSRQHINVVWFKRDLRLQDHAPLVAAQQAGLPVVLLFCFEPQLMAGPTSDLRHWRFAWEACQDLQRQLSPFGHELLVCQQEVLSVLAQLKQQVVIDTLFSHQETGDQHTFARDRRVGQWCREQGVRWAEYSQDGVMRGRQNRRGWATHLEQFLAAPLAQPQVAQLSTWRIPADLRILLTGDPLPQAFKEPAPAFQPGGETNAWRYWQSFQSTRAINYGRHLSKPALSRRSCSRLSPYLAWGNISPRHLWQEIGGHPEENPIGRSLHAFRTRLWWRSHYLQKLESDWRMEFNPINAGFAAADQDLDENLFNAWATGRTGYPMVDASIRCLKATGWINFRMRAMLVTFATFTLGLPWQQVAWHLARLFLDYEPGIHYPQVQMQAGLTGYHTLRIYNPTVQAVRHDPEGVFIHAWLPELRLVPPPQCFEPWKLTALEAELYQVKLGTDYPNP
ncbi:MAG: deoxyribodipyrimidine photo-lyase, partial [Lewinellaceae bacterium]|nr:deoxyribodipyrimidine photo-lyase [Lewinellaceae bacterium]